MVVLLRAYYFVQDHFFALFRPLEFLAPLLIRLYLAPIMIAAGLYKLYHLEDTINWFNHGLGLPEPEIMAYLASYTELVGGFLLLFGLATRWACIPLMVTMLVAAYTVHWDNGWFAIAPSNPATSTAKPLADVGVPLAQQSLENSVQVGKRLQRARELLMEHGNYNWLTEKGGFAVLNNGIEFAATYFIMLLTLFFTGAGRWLSLDYYLDTQARGLVEAKNAAS
ncbi:DoxX family protein [Spongiibacter sp. KMU-166]|uniref:DoxX family protein n=1 Tax=Spongiibacter thalassae TaxID=2721624 RepID=A0ABX1GIB1_9GAMM|nr:DoxX family protein [Spongiibacter thalassae]NKI18940.1 DoxX family protein [Spongiibacter thalassae]